MCCHTTSIDVHNKGTVETVEWTTGMDYWNGLLEWTTGMMEYWNSGMNFLNFNIISYI